MGNHNSSYTEDSIKSLDWKQHIRLRPGMYIGKLGDGSSKDDGIYVLIKEILDNSIDEHMMGYGKTIKIKVSDEEVKIRDFGRGIPLGKVIDCVSKINTGGKWGKTKVPKLRHINSTSSAGNQRNVPSTARDSVNRNSYDNIKRSGSLSARETMVYQKRNNQINKTKKIIKNVNTRTALSA